MKEGSAMKRRIVLGVLWAGIIAASVSYSQQGVSVEQLQSIDAVKNSIDLCAVSLKSNLLGIISSGGGVKLYDIPALKEKTILALVPLHVNTLSFSGSGQTLALGTTDGNAYIFNINTPTDLKKLSPHSLGITSIAIQGENWLFSAGVDKKVIITDVVNGTELGSLPDFQEDVTAIAVHPGAKHFTVGLSTGKVQVYAIAKLELQKTLVTGKDKISTIVIVLMENFLPLALPMGMYTFGKHKQTI